MSRLWRKNAGALLIAFMVLDIALWAYTATAGATINSHINLTAQQGGWTITDAFFAWRVWRGSRIAWVVLLALNVLVLLLMLFGAVSWSAYDTGLWAFLIAQTVVLLAPAVRNQVRQGQQSLASS